MIEFQDPAAIDFMLDETDVWAVVGLSGNPHRAAFSVAGDLQAHGKRIVPIHPTASTPVLGEKVYPTLADVPFPVDVVDVFRRSEAAGEFADQAVTINAKGVWFQIGGHRPGGLPAHARSRHPDGHGSVSVADLVAARPPLKLTSHVGATRRLARSFVHRHEANAPRGVLSHFA